MKNMSQEQVPGQENKAFTLTPEYTSTKKNFGIEILEDNAMTEKEKLEELNNLAEKIKNKNDSADFENFLLYGVKAQNPGLYIAFKKDLKDSPVKNIENNPENLAA